MLKWVCAAKVSWCLECVGHTLIRYTLQYGEKPALYHPFRLATLVSGASLALHDGAPTCIRSDVD